MSIKDKVAVVTGAASGIGKEIAGTYVRSGAKVVIADLNQAGADAAAAELNGGGERRAIGVAMNVTDEAQVDAGMDKAVAAFGHVDILVSNAGIQTVAPLDQFDFALTAAKGAVPDDHFLGQLLLVEVLSLVQVLLVVLVAQDVVRHRDGA